MPQVHDVTAVLKRREDACALPKLRETGTASWINFARSALGLRGVFASLSGFLPRASRRANCDTFTFESGSQFASKLDRAGCIAVDTYCFAADIDIAAFH
jgi:hypothetical protein